MKSKSETTDERPALVLVPRQIARRALGTLMSEISEDCWCAGWLDGNGAALWRLMEQGGGRYGQGEVSPEQAAELRVLSDALDEWMEWDDGASDVEPIPLPEWRRRMETVTHE
jgi:hypothetical protein